MRSWLGSWSVALRMARREVRRHKGRSAMVLLMVGIPTALLVFGLTLVPTSTISGAERIPYELGTAQALVQPPQPQALYQDGEGFGSGGSDTPATPVPGYTADAPTADRAAAIGRLLGGTAYPTTQLDVRSVQGDAQPRRFVLVLDGRGDFGERLRLTSGRWPTTSTEIVATTYGAARGLPTSGSVELLVGGKPTPVTVVGTASTLTQWDRYDLVSLTDFGLGHADQWSYLVKRSTPVLWPEVKKLNAYGLMVTSAEVLRHPPALSELAPEMRDQQFTAGVAEQGLVVAGGAILLLVTCLLVGPAFAVSAARQRRTLALAASNGAETTQLRHTVLAQAVVLGVLAAAGGAALGVLGVVATAYALPTWFDQQPLGPLDVPWLQIAGVTAIAMLSALIAAMVPARRLGRLDIIGVMKGQNVSPPLSRVVPLIGLAAAVLGGFVLFSAIVGHGRELSVVAGTFGLVIGTLLLVPMFLVLFARLASRLPVPLRMATRDAARQRTRSTPSVAAIVGAVAALTVLLVGMTSDSRQQEKEYQPEDIAGEASIHLPTDGFGKVDVSSAARTEAVVARVAPALVVVRLDQAAPMWLSPTPVTEPVEWVNVVPDGCTPQETVLGQQSGEIAPEGPKCQRYGSTAAGNHSAIGSLPAAEIARRLQLSDADAAKVRDGAVVVLARSSAATLTIAKGTMVNKPVTGETTDVTVTGTSTVPAITVAPSAVALVGFANQTGLLATPETVARLDLPMTPTTLLVRSPSGPIDRATEQRLDDALGGETWFHVERGFERQDALIMAILLGVFGFLLLVITLTSTALSMAEQRSDDATLAAVGATRGTRRAMAAAQSLVICGIGAVLGFAVGLVPGVAIAHPLTVSTYSCDAVTGMCTDIPTATPATVVIPWVALAIAVIGVPLLAALISALAVRRAPQMTRRAT